MAVCQVAGLGQVVWRKLQVSYDLPKPSSAPPRHALSCPACRDDCVMLRNNQVQSDNVQNLSLFQD